MKPPKFKIEDYVLHKPKNKVGIIQKIINLDDKEDIKIQGYRYYVDHSGWRWSIPEEFLLSRPKTNKIPLNKINELE